MALDTESTGLEWAEDRSTLLLATTYARLPDGNVEWYGIAGHDRIDQLVTWVLQFVGAGGTLVLQNAKFDLHQIGLDPASFPQRGAETGAAPAVVDTSVLAHLIDSRQLKRLEELESKYLGTSTKANFLAKTKTTKLVARQDTTTLAYALNDARVTLDLARVLWRKCEILGLLPLYRKEERYMRLLWRAERRGITVDMERVDLAVDFLKRQLCDLEERFFTAVGYKFLWTSSKQLSKALYEDYRTTDGRQIPKPKNPYEDADGVDRSKFRDRGRYNSASTSSFLLLEKANHPLGSLVLALRETSKLLCVFEGAKSGAKSGWRQLAHRHRIPGEQVGGISRELWTIHTHYNMTGTRTGRLSSSRPQVQNVPNDVRVHETQAVYSGDAFHRTEAYNLRRCLVARPGYLLVSLDHKQQEGRLFGIISQDPVMKEALEKRLDIHKVVAKLVWGVEDDLHREWAKTISFGLIYGMTTGSLQHRLNKTPEEARAIAAQYQGRFPRLMPFLQECITLTKQCRYVRYWSGRYWREDDPEFAYKSCNALVQGGSADLISIAALRCQEWLDSVGIDGHLLLVVHDELVFEIQEDRVAEATPKLLELMEVPDLLGMPFPADSKVGRSFGEMKK
jgi:DNA polymerase-1